MPLLHVASAHNDTQPEAEVQSLFVTAWVIPGQCCLQAQQ